VADPDRSAQQVEAARQTETARTRWLDPAWRAAVMAWVEVRLQQHGIRITGSVEQPHIRPWSTALSIPTTDGLTWFKAGGPGNSYEAALLEAVVRWRTPWILEPLALDAERGWMLFPDGGTRLRETLAGGAGIDAWQRVLAEWASLQRGLAPRASALLALGVPDRRPGVLAGHLETLIDDPAAQLETADRARLRTILPTYARWCAELDALGIDASLQHDDLHDGNVFVGPDGDRIFDWGDSGVAHPFGTLLVTFRSIASRGLGDARAERRALVRLRDAYLEPWTDRYPRATLAEGVPLAMRVAIVGRALSWRDALAGIPPEEHGPWAGNVGGWLLDLFEPTPL